MKKYFGITAAIVLSSVTLAACGGGDSGGGYSSGSGDSSSTSDAAATPATGDASTGGGGGSGGTIKVSADPSGALAFTQTSLTAKAGPGTLEFENASSTGHNVEIEDSSGKVVAETDTITDDKTSTGVDLKPGTYTFFCDIPGHREAGMQGTLKVQ